MSGRLVGLRLIAFNSSQLVWAWLVAGGAVELRLGVRSDLWRLLFAFLLLLAFFLDTGADHLGRVLAVLRVQPKPFWWRLGAVLNPLRDEDAGVGLLGDCRRALDKVILYCHQLLLGLLPKRGQLG